MFLSVCFLLRPFKGLLMIWPASYHMIYTYIITLFVKVWFILQTTIKKQPVVYLYLSAEQGWGRSQSFTTHTHSSQAKCAYTTNRMTNDLWSPIPTANVQPLECVHFISEGDVIGLWCVHTGISWIFGTLGVRSHCGPTGGTTLRAQMAWCGWWTVQTDWGWKTVGRSSVPCCWRRYDTTTFSWQDQTSKVVVVHTWQHVLFIYHYWISALHSNSSIF